MKMKKIIPLMMMATVPVMGVAQNQSGLYEKNFDRSVRPQDDFYQFATGGWQKNNPLPAAYSRFGSFDQLQEDNNKRINTILGELQKKKYKQGTIEQKLSDFYKLALDVDRRNKDGIAPVKGLLDEIEAAKSVKALRALQLKYAAQGYGIQYAAGFGADEKDVKNNILNIYQSGLTLGKRTIISTMTRQLLLSVMPTRIISCRCSACMVLQKHRPRSAVRMFSARKLLLP